MMLKNIAKKIITSAPFSVEYSSEYIPSFLKSSAQRTDSSLQSWALTQSDFFSEDDWREIQLAKLKKIIIHAGRNVPYWQKLFKKINFNPEKFHDFGDLAEIPIMTRADIKKISIEDLTSKNILRSRLVETATSGSTAEPFKFFHDIRDLFRRTINTFQELRYIGFSSLDPILIIGLESQKDLQNIGYRVYPLKLESKARRKNEVYPLIYRLQPRIIISTPSYLERFLYFCKKDSFLLKVEAIKYLGESLSRELEENLKNFFGCKIFSTYGTKECSIIGFHCQKGGLHTAPWMNFVEIIDGQFVVTLFENEVMPFIRYAIGDEGIFLKDICQCGRVSKLIEFNGRIADLIRLPNGKTYPVFFILDHLAMSYADKIKKFQLEQTEISSLIFRFVPIIHVDAREISDKLVKYFDSIFNHEIKVFTETVQDIFPNKNGKTPIFIKRI